jgi:hypothetical protein
MAKERKALDINKIHGGSELLQLVEELRETRESRVITHDGEDVAILRPIRRARSVPRPRRKTGIITKDDSLWNIIGMAESAGATDVATHKHDYLAEAYADRHD